jgi:Tfp pilus assembly protein PilZ
MDQSSARRFPRVNSEHVISVRPLTSTGAAGTVTTSKVVGLGGIMFLYPKRLGKGKVLELTILAGVEPLTIPVKVVWCGKADKGGWQVGVEFQEISENDQDKILDLLMRRVYLEEEIGPEAG